MRVESWGRSSGSVPVGMLDSSTSSMSLISRSSNVASNYATALRSSFLKLFNWMVFLIEEMLLDEMVVFSCW